MKAILYVAAALMISASIYGFVDYRKISHQKEFKAMYGDNETTDQAVAEEKTQTAVVPVLDIKEFSRSSLRPEADPSIAEEKILREPANEIKSAIANLSKKLGKKTGKKKRKEYEILVESFSRAPLIPPVKEEVVEARELKEVKVKEQ